MRFLAFLLALLSGAPLGAQSTPPAATLALTANCPGTYVETDKLITLTASCAGSAQPIGGATISFSFAADVVKEQPANIRGSAKVELLSKDTVEATVTAASVVAAAGGHRLTVAAGITGGSGILRKAAGSLSLVVVGSPSSTSQVPLSISGSASVSAPSLNLPPADPSGPGTLGDPGDNGGGSCGNPVTLSNGNMYHQFSDLVVLGRGVSIRLIRTYNAQGAARDSAFGFGWTHNYAASLRVAETPLVYLNGAGASVAFAAEGDGFAPARGGALKLQREGAGYLLTTREGWTRQFDAAGRMVSVAGPNGNALLLDYDAEGWLAAVRDGTGQELRFRYDAEGHILQASDASGRAVAYEYTDGELSASTDSLGQRTAYAYSRAGVREHLLASIEPPSGGKMEFSYDEAGRVARTIDQEGGTLDFEYLPDHTVVTNALGVSTAYAFNSRGNITGSWLGGAEEIDRQEWDESGRLVTRTDASGFAATLGYDAQGRLSSFTAPDGTVSEFAYDAGSGQLARAKLPGGLEVSYESDARGNITRAVGPLGLEVIKTFGARGELLAATRLGRTVEYRHDDAGNLAAVTDAEGTVYSASYDALRRPAVITDPRGLELKLEYDAAGRLVRTTSAGAGETKYEYSPGGLLTRLVSPTRGSLSFEHDRLGNLVKTSDAPGRDFVYDYRPANTSCAMGGMLSSATNPAGETERFEYDARGRLKQAILPGDRSRQYEWNLRGDLTARIREDGARVAYGHDASGRLIWEQWPDGERHEFSHDEAGNLTGAIFGQSKIQMKYDALRRLTEVADEFTGARFRYEYEPGGQLAAVIGPGEAATRYEYDKVGRPRKVTSPSGRAYGITYGSNRLTAAISYPNGTQVEFGYDEAARLASVVLPAGKFAATYRSSGDPATLADLAGLHTFEFDGLRRLTAASHPTHSGERYSYEPNGARTDPEGSPRFTHDPEGNATLVEFASGTRAFAFDPRNRLVAARLEDGLEITFLYDALGRRVERTARGEVTRWIYSGSRLAMVTDGSGRPIARFTWASNLPVPLEMETPQGVYFGVPDTRGNLGAWLDESGKVAASLSYDSFGAHQVTGISLPYAPSFQGRWMDPSTGLLLFGERDYLPASGRFLQPDPLDLAARIMHSPAALQAALREPQRQLPYAYAANNPLSFTDKSGQDYGPSAADFVTPPDMQAGGLMYLQSTNSQSGNEATVSQQTQQFGERLQLQPARLRLQQELRDDLQQMSNSVFQSQQQNAAQACQYTQSLLLAEPEPAQTPAPSVTPALNSLTSPVPPKPQAAVTTVAEPASPSPAELMILLIMGLFDQSAAGTGAGAVP